MSRTPRKCLRRCSGCGMEKITNTTNHKVMTDGVLLAETQTDPLLKKYDTLIIDEAHERNLNIDFLIGFIKQLLPKNERLLADCMPV